MKEPSLPDLPRVPAGVPRRHLSTILVFGVAFVLGGAPFLGVRQIPGFAPLIAVFPEKHRALLVPISSFLFGLVALAVQFYAGERIARRGVRRAFQAVLVLVVIGALALMSLLLAYVVVVDGIEEPFVIGWSRRPSCSQVVQDDCCPCPPGGAEGDCIAGLALEVEQCWTARSIFQVKLALYLAYLLEIEGFSLLAGLLVLQRPRDRRRTGPSTAKPVARSPGES